MGLSYTANGSDRRTAAPYHHADLSSPEKLAVRPCTHQLQFLASRSIDQQPIGLDMALAMPSPVADQGVIAIAFIERLLIYQGRHYDFKPRYINALAEQPLDVAPKLGRLAHDERHDQFFQSANSAAVLPKTWPPPLSSSFIASSVS